MRDLKDEILKLEKQIQLKREILAREERQAQKDALDGLRELHASMKYNWSVKQVNWRSGFDESRPGISLVGELDNESVSKIEAFAEKFPEFWSKLKEDQWGSDSNSKPQMAKQSVTYFADFVAPDICIVVHDGSGFMPIKEKSKYAVLTKKQWDDLSTKGIIPK